MALLSATDLKAIEKKHSDGISSADIVKIFKKKGERFSEPTLRKYVQLGLLPKSRRVGIRGKHRGSSGLYPVIVVRLINQIKKDLENGLTLDQIRLGTVGLSGEIQAMEAQAEQVFARFREAIKVAPRTQQGSLKKQVEKHQKSITTELKALNKLSAGATKWVQA